MSDLTKLSRREREIMEIVFALGEASLTGILERVENPPTRPALRSILVILERKRKLKHIKRGREFIYRPVGERRKVGRTALKRVLDTFFSGSMGEALASHLNDPRASLSDKDLSELIDLVESKRQRPHDTSQP